MAVRSRIHKRHLLITFVITITSAGLFAVPIHAQLPNFNSSVMSEQCSRTCISKFCDALPVLRYGKYCGLLYSGCPGEQPCDGLDACCMHHDHCIGKMRNDYLSQRCNKGLLKCVKAFRRSGAPSFQGNTCDAYEIAKAIHNAMRAAIFARKVFGKT